MAGSKKTPFCSQTKVFEVVANVDEIFKIFVLPSAPIGKVFNILYACVMLLYIVHGYLLAHIHKQGIMLVVVGEDAQRMCLKALV